MLHRETLRTAETILCSFKMLIERNMKSPESLQDNFVSQVVEFEVFISL